MLFTIVTGFSDRQKTLAFTALDTMTVVIAMLGALALGAPGAAVPWALIGVLCLFDAVLGLRMGLTRMKLNAFETRAVTLASLKAASLGGASLALAPVLSHPQPIVVQVLFTLSALVGAVAWRIGVRHVVRLIYLHGEDTVRVLIYGAGTTGRQLAAALVHDEHIRPVAFVDDNPTLQSRVVEGLRVYAPSHLPALTADRRVDKVVLAIPSLGPASQARITQRLRNVGCEVHALPSFASLVGGGVLRNSKTPVAVSRLLGRNRLERELPGVTHTYAGRRILITGAGGSIGSELCRQLVGCHPDCLVLVDHTEFALYAVDKELRDLAPELEVVPVLGSVTDETLMREAMDAHGIDVVIHAAAYKHVPMVEANPLAGLGNNVLGTRTLAEAARRSGVERFILVSSDKAVRPTNVMGASKRLAELVVQDLAARCRGTCFSMVRFGNVLGSSGSVIPLFEEQIARGGPVTLTDTRVTRYFMTVSEAVRLVLLAGSFARGGEVFVLDMGKPVPIRKLAEQMIEGAGLTVKSEANPEGDIDVQITGLRPGEKLHEELLISPDMLTTPHPKILRAQEIALSEIEVATALKDLRKAIELRDDHAARAVIARWVEQDTHDNPALNIG